METKICRTCGDPKDIDEFVVIKYNGNPTGSRKLDCNGCRRRLAREARRERVKDKPDTDFWNINNDAIYM